MVIVQIIQMIMQILAFIAGLFNPNKMSIREVAYVTDFDCGQVEWVQAPAMQDGSFVGKASVHCLFEGKGHGGIAALRAHLVSQLPKDGGMSGGSVQSYGGTPGIAYATSLKMGEGAIAHGTTHISSGGSVLRDVFESSSIEASGNGRYLKSVYAEMNVADVDGLGTYDLEVVQAISVKKPGMMSASDFVSKLKEQAEESLIDRAVSAVQESASKL